MALVEPEKSASATTSGGHSGWVSTTTPGLDARKSRMFCAVKRSCTSQAPSQVMILILVWLATFCARYLSGTMMTVSTPFSRAMSSTTATALEDVQHTSLSAFTSADVFT